MIRRGTRLAAMRLLRTTTATRGAAANKTVGMTGVAAAARGPPLLSSLSARTTQRTFVSRTMAPLSDIKTIDVSVKKLELFV